MTVDALFLRMSKYAQEGRQAVAGTNGVSLSYQGLIESAEQLARKFRDAGVRVLATLLDNGPQWIAVDLAALRADVVHISVGRASCRERVCQSGVILVGAGT